MATSMKAKPATTAGASTAKSSSVAKSNSFSLSKLFGGMAPTGANNGAAKKPAVGGGRFFLGMMIYLLGAQVAQIGLTYLDVRFHWQLERRSLGTLPVLGNINMLMVLFIAILVGLLWALYRFKILPSGKDMVAARQANLSTKGGAIPGKTTTAKTVIGAKGATAGKPTNGKTPEIATAGAKNERVKETFSGAADDLYQRVKAQQRALAARKRRAR